MHFYRKENAENRGVTQFYNRTPGREIAKSNPFALDLEKSDDLTGMYADTEHEDGYYRVQSVLGD